MKRLLTAAQMRAVDEAAMRLGVPSVALMENAGAAVAHRALELVAPTGKVLVLCGLGNNGGDGLVAARHLANAGRLVRVEMVGEVSSLKGDALQNLQALSASAASVQPIETAESGDLVIDALFGTGLSRPVEGRAAKAIEKIASLKAQGAKVLSVDVPSGLSSDTGQPLGPCVAADATVTFAFLKVAHAVEPGVSLCGQVDCVDIGIPRAAHAALPNESAQLVEESDALGFLPVRAAVSHKGTYGHLLVVAGSEGKTGAAALTSMAALRSGVGLVTVAARGEVLPQIQAHAPELMGAALPGSGALGQGDLAALLALAADKRAVVLGPGISRGAQTHALIAALLEKLAVPLLIDADGLNALAEDPEVLAKAKVKPVLTPHPGEMARLLAASMGKLRHEGSDRLEVASHFARHHGCVLVLKGARTLVAANGHLWVNPTGNAGMATAGTGDVLAGVIGSFLAQGLSGPDAAVCGTYAHGLAGDLCIEATGLLGLTATDVLTGLTRVWTRWKR